MVVTGNCHSDNGARPLDCPTCGRAFAQHQVRAHLIVAGRIGRLLRAKGLRAQAEIDASSIGWTCFYGNLELLIFDDGTNRWFAQRNAT
jgi:hypothetical protein